jgi:hypothetical protein
MHSSSPIHSHCQNCGTELKGPYCHVCGQHDFETQQSFTHLVHEVLENFFHFEGKFFHGIYDLLFRPGETTKSFNAGKRASQMPPLRLYIFVSLLFFLAPSPDSGNSSADFGPSAVKPHIELTSKDDSPGGAKEKDSRFIVFLNRFLNEKLSKSDEVTKHFVNYLPKMMWVCMPVFALLSWVAFHRAGMGYLQHLVFSLHLHSYFMLFWLTFSGWAMIAKFFSSALASWLSFASVIYMVVYAYLALRNVFGQRRRGTLLRGALLLGTYGLVLLTGIIGTLIVALIMV